MITINNLVQGKPYFTNISSPPKQYLYLTENKTTEVLIVGGGVTGALLAHYLTKNNIKCILAEKSRIGHGSTSINTALLKYELDDNLAQLNEYTTYDNRIKSYKLCLKALKDLDDIINEQGNNCNYHKTDSLLFTNKTLDEKEIIEEFISRKKADIDVTLLDSSTNPFDFEVKSGILSKNGGAVIDPFKFTHQLLSFSKNRGAEIYENTVINQINYYENKIEAITEYDYKIMCNYVVCATGYNVNLFTSKPFGTKYITYNIVTSPLENFDPQLKNLVMRDNCSPCNYLRITEDNRLILGGENETYEQNIYNKILANKKYELLTERLKSMIHNVDDTISIDYKICGKFIATRDNLGYIGADEYHKNLYYCLGYGANGIVNSILGSQFLAKLFKGEEDPDMELFNPNR